MINGKEYVRSRLWSNLGFLNGIFLAGLRELPKKAHSQVLKRDSFFTKTSV